MVQVQVVTMIGCSPDDVLDFVMDIERYAAEVDDKIKPVLWSHREGSVVQFACRPKLIGLRQPKVVQRITLTPGRRIDIGLVPAPANRLAHTLAEFAASFACRPVPGGTEVTRTLEFRFKPVVRWLLEPLLRRRLPAEVEDELRRAKAYLEQRTPQARRG